MELHGKNTLITGGTRGIGAATAIAFARAGANAVLVGRHHDDDAAATRKAVEALGRRCEIIVADCAKPAEAARSVQEAVARLGSLDVLVHAAGGPRSEERRVGKECRARWAPYQYKR